MLTKTSTFEGIYKASCLRLVERQRKKHAGNPKFTLNMLACGPRRFTDLLYKLQVFGPSQKCELIENQQAVCNAEELKAYAKVEI